MNLSYHDLAWCVKRLPKNVVGFLQRHSKRLIVAGGFIRACIANEKVNDVDIFADSRELSRNVALELSTMGGLTHSIYLTENAYTVHCSPFPIQFIHKWIYKEPMDVVHSFDFTIAKAAFWYNKDTNAWDSYVHDNFYSDLAAKRLVYTSPIRNEDAGGSLLRVLKFYQKGYRIPLDSLGAVISRLMQSVDLHQVNLNNEEMLSKVITGLLIEVDPNVDLAAYCVNRDLND